MYILVKSDKLQGFISSLIFIATELQKLYIWNQGSKGNKMIHRSSLETHNYPTFLTFLKLSMAAAPLILGAYWEKLYVWNQESLMYKMVKDFFNF